VIAQRPPRSPGSVARRSGGWRPTGILACVEWARLRHVWDVSVGAWIAPRLGPFGGWVGSVVPRGFDAYVRILHPVATADGQPATWRDVCTATGRHAHALMQWRAISCVTPPAVSEDMTNEWDAWNGSEPDIGNLDAAAFGALCRVLSRHTDSDTECFFALWDGYGWIHGSPSIAAFQHDEPIPPAFSRDVLVGPRLRLPQRDYLVFSGPLDAAHQLRAQSPNLMWPNARSWFVATEIDFDSTLVGGSNALIRDLLSDAALETWRVDPRDSLAYDGDMVNV
jgi:hypothetical protein